MVKALAILLLCLVLFAAGLACSWFLILDRPPLPGTSPAELPSQPSAAPLEVARDAAAQAAAELPMAIRDQQALTAEEIFRFGETYRHQQQALAAEQERIARDKHRIELVYDDIRGAQRELDGFQAQIEDTLARAQSLLERIEKERRELQHSRQQAEEQLQQARSQQTAVEADQTENLKKMATWFQQMDAEKAAEILVQYSNEGKLDTAIKLLSFIEERNVAKILSAIDDATLSFELTEKYLTLRPADATQR